MSNKEMLRAFIARYGELALLKDLASIFNDLGIEWADAGERSISYTFSDSSNIIASIADRLERIEHDYAEKNGGATQKELVAQKAEVEYKSLMSYFEKLSLSDFSTLFTNSKPELMSKLKRLEYLKRIINNNDDKK